MINAIIDVGSNSIRLSVYETGGEQYTKIYTAKRMVGLASYVFQGKLSEIGIVCACEALLEFRTIISSMAVNSVSVFATASLRNISNSDTAIKAIEEATGYLIEVISGQDEACLGYYGSMPDICTDSGTFIDIGGGSTEIVFFSDRQIDSAQSLPVGSLNLQENYVSEHLPTAEELILIKEKIDAAISAAQLRNVPHYENLYAIGGTARATVKLANRLFDLDSANRTITSKQLSDVKKLFCGGSELAYNMLAKHCPDRINTIVPGILILDSIAKLTEAKKLTISRFSVREGYLCQRVLLRKI